MILQKILGFLVKRWATLVMLLGLGVSGYLARYSPMHPDPASGHVFRVTATRGRHLGTRTLYLTSSERSLYYASIIVMAAGALGILAPVLIRNRNRNTSV